MVVGLGGLAFLPSRTSRGRVLARTGFVCAAAGFTVLALATVVQAAFFGGDFPWMPLVVLPGVVALLAGVDRLVLSQRRNAAGSNCSIGMTRTRGSGASKASASYSMSKNSTPGMPVNSVLRNSWNATTPTRRPSVASRHLRNTKRVNLPTAGKALH